VPIVIGLRLELYGVNPSLFIPASIAVIASFGLYFLRQWRRRRRVEAAIKIELNQMDDLTSLPENLDSLHPAPPDGEISAELVPTPESLPTHVYDSNIPQLSLLHRWVHRDVVDFYTILKRHKPTLRQIHQENASAAMADQEDLYRDAEDLKEKRKSLLDKIG